MLLTCELARIWVGLVDRSVVNHLELCLGLYGRRSHELRELLVDRPAVYHT